MGVRQSKGLRILKAKESRELKFLAVYLAPNVKYTQLFSKVDLAGEGKAAGIQCWKLTCTPLAKFKTKPITIFVSKDSYLVIKTIEKLEVEKEMMDVSTFFGNYKNVGGIMTSKLMISHIGDQIMESKLVSAEWNVKLSDAEFDKPKTLSKAK